MLQPFIMTNMLLTLVQYAHAAIKSVADAVCLHEPRAVFRPGMKHCKVGPYGAGLRNVGG
jgi:hypothetical protein